MTSITSVRRALQQLERRVAVDEGRLDQLQRDREALISKGEELKGDWEELNQVLGLFAALEKDWQRDFEDRLAALITRGLCSVFGEDLEFKLIQKTVGDASAIDFKLVTHVDGEARETDLIGAKGGSVVVVAGFLLRLLILLSYRPALRPVMLLDETFAHLSADYVPNFALLLQRLNEETDVQFVLVTHDPTYVDYCDVAYEVSQDSAGVTSFAQLKSRREIA